MMPAPADYLTRRQTFYLGLTRHVLGREGRAMCGVRKGSAYVCTTSEGRETRATCGDCWEALGGLEAPRVDHLMMPSDAGEDAAHAAVRHLFARLGHDWREDLGGEASVVLDGEPWDTLKAALIDCAERLERSWEGSAEDRAKSYDRSYMTQEGPLGEPLEAPVPMRCRDCDRAAYWDEGDMAYHHATDPARGCFLIPAEPGREPDGSHPDVCRTCADTPHPHGGPECPTCGQF